MHIKPLVCFSQEELSLLQEALSGWRTLRQDASLDRDWLSSVQRLVNTLTKQRNPSLSTCQMRVLVELLARLGVDGPTSELVGLGLAKATDIGNQNPITKGV